MDISNFLKKTTFVFVSAVLLNPIAGLAQDSSKLTNADVVRLFKAGLSEDTIILSIQNTPSTFDTSPQALIELKNQGVSQKILNAMLNAKPTTSATNIGIHEDSQGNTINITLSSVRLITGDREYLMKRRKANFRSSSGALRLFTGFGQSKKKAVISGSKSDLRISGQQPKFQLLLPYDVHPSDYFVLVKLKPKKDRREIETGREGLGANLGEGLRVKDGFREKSKIPLTYEEVQSNGSPGMIMYNATIEDQLGPGEYALVYQDFYYDFGVDS